ncbi:type II and III secretion system protein [Thiomicrorhabdus immobilis]|uniref:Type II and III secretion system protein n=1 Tax=Thiomicrorhabdus immobilis TaxID=2791037 RepID=A0ABN6CY54_9GAMM|nr:pilus (MSHA type) biogenesis protein MshL [Thiomicrorhabdus immobilis]BCN93935.1 type II and III secretion system protein [Thiomicrorhabdus immobilis]
MNKNINTFSSNLIIFTLLFTIGGCQESSVKRDPIAPPVSEKLAPSGHIQAKPKVEDVVSPSAAIPGVVTTQIPSLPPLRGMAKEENYSISAVNVPVAELLFKLAKDSGKEMDIYAGIAGNVTINAINQPLDRILERIAEQVGFIYELNNNTIAIKPDFPEWRNYKVDYVNIVKKSNDSIDMKMSVSSSTTASRAGSAKASSTKVSVESVHNFWDKLEKNVQLLAQLDPNASRVILANPANNGQMTNTPSPSSPALSSISQNTVVNPEAGVISVYTTSLKHKSIKEYIDEVTQRAERQVLIEATVVEVLLNDDYQAGIDWSLFGDRAFGNDGGLRISSPFSGPTDGFSVATVDNAGSLINGAMSGDWNILANLKLLKQFGDSKVLSSPKIMAINNQTALLKVVNNLVYFSVDVTVTPATTAGALSTTTYETEINTVPVGFTMSVTPFVSENGDVTLNVRPTISRKIGEVNDPNPDLAKQGVVSSIPIIQEKEMSSVLRLKDRQTAIIGGLIEDNNSNTRTGLPWVSDVPVVGDLFSTRDDSTQKSELVIFIRPVIVKNPDVDNGDLNSVSRFLQTDKY